MTVRLRPHPHDADDESARIVRAQAGDRGAMSELVDRCRRMVFVTALRMTGSEELAEEIAQDSLVHAIQRLGEFRGGSRFSTWVYAIVRNRCLDELRKRPPPVVRLPVTLASEAAAPDDALAVARDHARMQALLLTLPESQREAFVLRHVEELEYEEIAERCGISVNNAKVRVHRARETLAKKLEGTS